MSVKRLQVRIIGVLQAVIKEIMHSQNKTKMCRVNYLFLSELPSDQVEYQV
jgi:hypothetical protein